MISIITPWLNHSELCRVYARSTRGADVVVVDNGSDPEHASRLVEMVGRLQGTYLRNDENRLFAAANNQGLERARGDIVVFMNNDVECRPGWLAKVEQDVQPGALYAPSKLNRHGMDYLEGWCIAARKETWLELGGWPEHLPGMYYEDNFLCLKAQRMGIELNTVNWQVWHFNNYTSRQTPGAFDHSAANAQAFQEALKDVREQVRL